MRTGLTLVALCLSLAVAAPLRADYYIRVPPAGRSHMEGKETIGPFPTEEAARQFLRDSHITASGWDIYSSGASGATGTVDNGETLQQQVAELAAVQATLGANSMTQAFARGFARSLFAPRPPDPGEAQRRQAQLAAEQLTRMGSWYLRNKDYKNAAIEFEKALARDPANSAARRGLAQARQLQALAERNAAAATQTSQELTKLLGAAPTDPANGAAEDPFMMLNLDTRTVDLRGSTRDYVDPARVAGRTTPEAARESAGAQFDQLLGVAPAAGTVTPNRTQVSQDFDRLLADSGPTAPTASSASAPELNPILSSGMSSTGSAPAAPSAARPGGSLNQLQTLAQAGPDEGQMRVTYDGAKPAGAAPLPAGPQAPAPPPANPSAAPVKFTSSPTAPAAAPSPEPAESVTPPAPVSDTSTASVYTPASDQSSAFALPTKPETTSVALPAPAIAPHADSVATDAAATKTIKLLDRAVSSTLGSLKAGQAGESIRIDGEMAEIKAMLHVPPSGKKGDETVRTISWGHQQSGKSGEAQNVGQIIVVRNEETGEVHIDVMREQAGKASRQTLMRIDRFGNIIQQESR